MKYEKVQVKSKSGTNKKSNYLNLNSDAIPNSHTENELEEEEESKREKLKKIIKNSY